MKSENLLQSNKFLNRFCVKWTCEMKPLLSKFTIILKFMDVRIIKTNKNSNNNNNNNNNNINTVTE